MTAFRWPLRVYWEDTDAGGVVYHAQYVCFLERARSEWLRHRGLSQAALQAERGILFAVRAISLDFRKPARLDDALIATVSLVARRGASFDMAQTLERSADGTLLLTARVRAACLDAASFRPRPIPLDLLTDEPPCPEN